VTSTLAERLLDAQVAYHLDRLGGPDGAAAVTGLVAAAFDGLADREVAGLVDVDEVKDAVTRALTTRPDGPGFHALVDVVRDVVRRGPVEPFAVGEVVDRAQVEAVLDAALGLTPLLEKALDGLTASPLVATMATRFMARIVSEALQANQAVAEKVPGIGGLLSLGASLATSVATGAIGAADKQLDGLLGDTLGKGGTLAVGRLNRIVLETLRDPTTREAALQVWDLVAAEEVRGLGDRADAEEVEAVTDAVRALVVSTLAHPHTVALAHAVVDAVVESYGGYAVAELLDELDVDTAAVLAAVERRAPTLLTALRESGALEQWLRAELQPFYASAEVVGLLE
jgi:hypothetical protein